MIWLSTSTIARLRDQLRTKGQRPSVALGDGKATPEEAELATITAEYGPISEAMYLMMSADGKVTSDEREVLKGALRNLSGDTLRGMYIEALLERAAKAVEAEGRDARLKDVIATLHEDPARAEVAFVLAAGGGGGGAHPGPPGGAPGRPTPGAGGGGGGPPPPPAPPARAARPWAGAGACGAPQTPPPDEENETLNSLAEGLGIDDSRANELLDSVEADLAERPAQPEQPS